MNLAVFSLRTIFFLACISMVNSVICQEETSLSSRIAAAEDTPDDSTRITLYLEIASEIEGKTTLDSCLSYLEKAREMANRNGWELLASKASYQLGRTYITYAKPEQSLPYLEAALNAKGLDEKEKTKIYNSLGIAHQRTMNFEQSESWYQKARNSAEDMGNNEYVNSILLNISNLRSEMGKKEESLEILHEIRSRQEKEAQPSLPLAKTYNGIGTRLNALGRYQESVQWFQKSLQIKEELKDSLGIAATYQNLSSSYGALGEDSMAENILEQAVEINQRLGIPENVANNYASLGLVFDNRGNHPKARELYLKSLNMGRELGSYRVQVLALSNLGAVHENMGDYAQALKYNFEAIELAEEKNDISYLSSLYHNIAIIYSQNNQIEKAMPWYEKALAMATQAGEKNEIIHTYHNMGLALLQIDDPRGLDNLEKATSLARETGAPMLEAMTLNGIGEYHEKKGDFQQAYNYFLQSRQIYSDVGTEKNIAKTNVTIARLVLGSYDNPVSEPQVPGVSLSRLKADLLSAVEILRKGNDYKALKSAYASLALIYKREGNYQKALAAMDEYFVMNDTLRNQSFFESTAEWQTRLETAQKEKAITLLEAEKEYQADQLRKSRQITWLAGLSAFLFLAAAFLLFNRMRFAQKSKAIVEAERQKSEELLLNILPASVAEELKETGKVKAVKYESVTILFTDFVSFTSITEEVSPETLINEIDHCFRQFDIIISRYNIEKIKTIGDAYMCAGGLPEPSQNHAHEVVKAAVEIRDWMENRIAEGSPLKGIRIGVHTGPVIAGVVGLKKFVYDIWGKGVNVASRIESNGISGSVSLSENTYELVKEDFECEPVGLVSMKNLRDMNMYLIRNS